MTEPRMPDECGVPDPFPTMHPIMKENFGKWKYHDRPRPGVLHHVAHSGDEIWTVRAGTSRQMDIHSIRQICDIADKFGDGYMRFTSRSNVEFMVGKEEQVKQLIDALGEAGYPIGGTGNSVSMISHPGRVRHSPSHGPALMGKSKSRSGAQSSAARKPAWRVLKAFSIL